MTLIIKKFNFFNLIKFVDIKIKELFKKWKYNNIERLILKKE